MLIESIDGISTDGKTSQDCVTLLHGEEGAPVKLALLETPEKQPEAVELTRQKIIVGQ